MISVFWFRRDLRLDDNKALNQALKSKLKVLPIFIFDSNITNELPTTDPRINFIYNQLSDINKELLLYNSSLHVLCGDPEKIFKDLLIKYPIKKVFFNCDYEPYAISRDKKIRNLLNKNKVETFDFKDQVIFEKDEIIKADGNPYTVFTPYKNKWLQNITKPEFICEKLTNTNHFLSEQVRFPSLNDLGFHKSHINVKAFDLSKLESYPEKRNFPAEDSTTYLGPHLRFGTVSIRRIWQFIQKGNDVFKSELIWREFFMQILFHFPNVVDHNFKQKYNGINWRNNDIEFDLWTQGKTGYPMVDAGIRELNQTGYMHNRVRMVVASFLVKHLLIDWKWGEAFFAQKLLDYELSSNNGNWQWVAGTGCDAAPYFRVFNPHEQLKKFDHDLLYSQKWIPELNTEEYPKPIIEHKLARERCLKTYKQGIFKSPHTIL